MFTLTTTFEAHLPHNRLGRKTDTKASEELLTLLEIFLSVKTPVDKLLEKEGRKEHKECGGGLMEAKEECKRY